MSERAYDVAIVGGGLVGAAIGHGLRELGSRLAIVDEGDVAHRAARGNFGLIWVQGDIKLKGNRTVVTCRPTKLCFMDTPS